MKQKKLTNTHNQINKYKLKKKKHIEKKKNKLKQKKKNEKREISQ